MSRKCKIICRRKHKKKCKPNIVPVFNPPPGNFPCYKSKEECERQNCVPCGVDVSKCPECGEIIPLSPSWFACIAECIRRGTGCYVPTRNPTC